MPFSQHNTAFCIIEDACALVKSDSQRISEKSYARSPWYVMASPQVVFLRIRSDRAVCPITLSSIKQDMVRHLLRHFPCLLLAVIPGKNPPAFLHIAGPS